MKHYLLSVLQPADGTPPPPDELAAIGRRLEEFHAALHEAGAFVYAGGLDSLGTARVVRPGSVSDGPYAETKEYLGGFALIDVPDDETAKMWAGRIAEACGWPHEVRRFKPRPQQG